MIDPAFRNAASRPQTGFARQRWGAVLAGMLVLAGCVSPPPVDTPPMEGTNTDMAPLRQQIEDYGVNAGLANAYIGICPSLVIRDADLQAQTLGFFNDLVAQGYGMNDIQTQYNATQVAVTVKLEGMGQKIQTDLGSGAVSREAYCAEGATLARSGTGPGQYMKVR